MRLFHTPLSCSVAALAYANDCGVPLAVEVIEFGPKGTQHSDFLGMDPRGKVPLLEIEPDNYLTETGAILQFLAVQAGTWQRYRDPTRICEWLFFIASTVHVGFQRVFLPGRLIADPLQHAAIRSTALEHLHHIYALVEKRLSGETWLLTEFSPADAHLWAMTRWCAYFGMNLGSWPKVESWYERASQRPAFAAIARAEDKRFARHPPRPPATLLDNLGY